MRMVLPLVALLGTTACGSSFIVLEIHAELEVPAEADSIRIVTREEANLDNELTDLELTLEDGQTFPIEVLFEPSEDTPSGYLRQLVTARLDGVAVARAEVRHPWTPHTTSRAKFSLEDIP